MSQKFIELLSGPHCPSPLDGKCITCADSATPVRLLRLDYATALAEAEFEGELSQIDVSLLDEVAPGDWVLVHGGVAFSLITPAGN